MEMRVREMQDIYIGHIDEMHYISTASISTPVSTCSTHPRPSTVGNSVEANKEHLDMSVINSSKSRKEYMREYMKKKE